MKVGCKGVFITRTCFHEVCVGRKGGGGGQMFIQIKLNLALDLPKNHYFSYLLLLKNSS